jgi:hypothetical protein
MVTTAAGWLAIVCGAAVTLLGVLFVSAMLTRGGVPVGGAGLFAVLTLGAGPVLTLSGIAIIVAGIQLMHGQEWARTVLQVFSWIALCGSAGWLGYSAIEVRHIHLIDVVHGSIFLLLTAAPAAVLILLLRR